MAHKNTDMELAASDCLDYFATSYRTERSRERKRFAEKAGKWLEKAVKRLGRNRIVGIYTFGENERDFRGETFGLASEALNSKAGWAKRRKGLEKDMKESLRLAEELDSLYSEGNRMLYAVLEREAAVSGEIDGEHLEPAIGELYIAIQSVLDWSNTAWAEHVNNHESRYSMVKPDIHELLEKYRNKLGDHSLDAVAAFTVGLEFCEPGTVGVTKEKLKSMVEGRKREITAGVTAPVDYAKSYKTQNTGYHC